MTVPAPSAPPVAAEIAVGLVAGAAAGLAALRDRNRLSTADVVNRALPLYDLIDAEITAGNRVVLRSPDGTEREMLLL